MESWLYHYNSLPVKFQVDWTTFQILGVHFVSSFGLGENFSLSAQILKLGRSNWVKISNSTQIHTPTRSNWVKIHKSVKVNQPTRFLQLLHFPGNYEI
jgi:hypothetical protein